ncbi:TPA: hypothetical protein ACK1AU_002605 [Staphylococcus aureus]
MKKKSLLLMMAVLLSMPLVACGNDEDTKKEAETNEAGIHKPKGALDDEPEAMRDEGRDPNTGKRTTEEK